MTITPLSLAVLSAIKKLQPHGHGATILDEIERQTGLSCSSWALYVSLERLEDAGVITSQLGQATVERGLRDKQHWSLTQSGEATLKAGVKAVRAEADRQDDMATTPKQLWWELIGYNEYFAMRGPEMIAHISFERGQYEWKIDAVDSMKWVSAQTLSEAKAAVESTWAAFMKSAGLRYADD